jgi:hypothetical protein
VVLLAGEAGVGQSRLGRELLARHPGPAKLKRFIPLDLVTGDFE